MADTESSAAVLPGPAAGHAVAAEARRIVAPAGDGSGVRARTRTWSTDTYSHHVPGGLGTSDAGAPCHPLPWERIRAAVCLRSPGAREFPGGSGGHEGQAVGAEDLVDRLEPGLA